MRYTAIPAMMQSTALAISQGLTLWQKSLATLVPPLVRSCEHFRRAVSEHTGHAPGDLVAANFE